MAKERGGDFAVVFGVKVRVLSDVGSNEGCMRSLFALGVGCATNTLRDDIKGCVTHVFCHGCLSRAKGDGSKGEDIHPLLHVICSITGKDILAGLLVLTVERLESRMSY